MEKSPTIGKLAKSLTAVQAAIRPAIKDANNPFFNSRYADLNSVWDSCRELLTANGLSVIQGNSASDGTTVTVETLLAHESGEWIQSELTLPLSKKDPQGVGSAVTYGRRYGLAAIVGIVADVDDDGNGASGGQTNGSSRPAPPRPSAPVNAALAPNQREMFANVIQTACKELNAANDDIKWKPATLDEYITEMFGKGIDFKTANEKQLGTVATDLAKRLAAITEKK